MKTFFILLVAAILIALPFFFHVKAPEQNGRETDLELVIITPHNAALRQEFERGFSEWHARKFGAPVRIDWRIIGGTTEIMRYLSSEFTASAKRFHAAQKDSAPPQHRARDLTCADDPTKITSRIDLFFGGGAYDHAKAEKLGLTVPAWPEGRAPPGLFEDADGRELIPRSLNNEPWRGKAFYGCVLSAFGICYNIDRLADLGIPRPPAAWEDLADPRYAGTLGLADPTKSGSVAKAFEMIIQTQCAKAVAAAGFTAEQVRAYESQFQTARQSPGEPTPAVPPAYQDAIRKGWGDGVNLVRRIGANARYFSDASGKIPVDVGMGTAAAGLVIDFFGRLQAELTTPPGQPPTMAYVTPLGGSTVTADPISLLRGAPHRELAARFVEFVLGEDGQRLWNYRVGTPGGPHRFALRRLPIRRDFYPSDDPFLQARFESRRPFLSDPLWQADSDAYRVGSAFRYQPRWTATHFGIQRDLIRSMCIDSGDELRQAWRAILKHGGPANNPTAMRLLEALPTAPVPLTWDSATGEYAQIPRRDLLRDWTLFFRKNYRAAEREAKRSRQTASSPESR